MEIYYTNLATVELHLTGVLPPHASRVVFCHTPLMYGHEMTGLLSMTQQQTTQKLQG